MTLTTGIQSDSLLARICNRQPLLPAAGEELLRRVSIVRWDDQHGARVQSMATIISVDNGNDAFKEAMLHFYVTFGIPNEELDLRGNRETTQQALRSLLRGTWTIRRSGEQGQVTTWVLHLLEIIPYPQSFASFVAWYYTPDGTPVETDIERHVTLDIGGGQLHECTVILLHQPAGRPKLRMSVLLLGDGTIAMARAARERLRTRYQGIHLSDVEVRQMWVSGTIPIEGRRADIRNILSDVVAARSRNLFAQLLPLLQEGQTFLMFTGGGSVLLAEHLHELVCAKRSPQSFLFVPREFAAVLDTIGGYIPTRAIAKREVGRSATPRP